MTLKTQMTTDLAVFFNDDEFAETVTYNGTDITAIVEYGAGRDTGAVARLATLFVKKSDVTLPAYRDTIIIGSDTWRVFENEDQEAVISGDGYVWKIPIFLSERPTLE